MPRSFLNGSILAYPWGLHSDKCGVFVMLFSVSLHLPKREHERSCLGQHGQHWRGRISVHYMVGVRLGTQLIGLALERATSLGPLSPLTPSQEP